MLPSAAITPHLFAVVLRSFQSAMPGPPLHSLVKYDTPSLLTTKGRGAKKGGAPGAKGGKKQLPPVEAKPQVTQTEDILNSILPPR